MTLLLLFADVLAISRVTSDSSWLLLGSRRSRLSTQCLAFGISARATCSGDSPLYPLLLTGTTGRWPLRGTDPKIAEGYSKLVKMVHEHGTKCFIELNPDGANFFNELGISSFLWPSITNTFPQLPFTPREIDESHIEAVVEVYGKAGKYIKEGGLDGVDLLADQASLLSEFLSKGDEQTEG